MYKSSNYEKKGIYFCDAPLDFEKNALKFLLYVYVRELRIQRH